MSLKQVLQQIEAASQKAGRKDKPHLMAVSKRQSIQKIEAAYQEGQRDFGENYAQELIEKAQHFEREGVKDIYFHLIGHLQTNKVKQILPHVFSIHSIDSFKLLSEIEKRAEAIDKKIYGFFQVNIDQEESKGGFRIEDLAALSEKVKACKFMQPVGLMCIPDPALSSLTSPFARMQELSQKYQATLGSQLSMGMSGDFEEAIRYGATIIRVGSAIFGAR